LLTDRQTDEWTNNNDYISSLAEATALATLLSVTTVTNAHANKTHLE